ncbi:MAG: glycosyl hydrolase 53 family protein [Saccharofermentans sp.]|nr:glycosyl hydrolase 53 family protein [Saccharofermentans sp.]
MIEMSEYIKGADVSTLAEIEKRGRRYFDGDFEGDLFEVLAKNGFNMIRLRLWNEPYTKDGKAYGAGTNDIFTLINLSKRAINNDMAVLLDFHLSDFFANIDRQVMPKMWENLSAPELSVAVYEFVVKTLSFMRLEGVMPTIIQIGNEIDNGILWPIGKDIKSEEFNLIMSSAVSGIKSVLPNVPLMIHLGQGTNTAFVTEWLSSYSADSFDIVGLSYDPSMGSIGELNQTLFVVEKLFHKSTLLAEVTCAGIEDADSFMQELLSTISTNQYNLGFFYFEPGLIPNKTVIWGTQFALEYMGEQELSKAKINPLFDEEGKAKSVLSVIRDFTRT